MSAKGRCGKTRVTGTEDFDTIQCQRKAKHSGNHKEKWVVGVGKHAVEVTVKWGRRG